MYIKAVVKTRMKEEKLVEVSKDHFEISVKEKPERNMANKRVIELIAGRFQIPANRVRIVNGHRHAHKLLIVEI